MAVGVQGGGSLGGPGPALLALKMEGKEHEPAWAHPDSSKGPETDSPQGFRAEGSLQRGLPIPGDFRPSLDCSLEH